MPERRKPHLTQEQIEEIRRRYAAGELKTRIAADFDISHQVVTYWTDERKRQSKLVHSRSQTAQKKRERTNKPVGVLPELETVPPDPPDERTLTGRLLGDPHPGRSALDQRGRMNDG